MSERFYLLIVGAYILLSLYLEIDLMIYLLSGFLLLEGLTNWRLTTVLQKLRKITLDSGLVAFKTKNRLSLEGIRMWRMVVAVVLASSYIMLHQYDVEYIWFFPWFMGFAIMGAGVSGMCPMLMALRWVGFK